MYSLVCSCESHPLVGWQHQVYWWKQWHQFPVLHGPLAGYFSCAVLLEMMPVSPKLSAQYHVKCRRIVAHDNAVLRHCEDCLPQRLPSPRNKILDRKNSVINRKKSFWHSNFPLPVVKLSNISWLFMKLLTTFSCSGFSPAGPNLLHTAQLFLVPYVT